MNLAKIQLEDISDHFDPNAIKNFIISDKIVPFPSLSSNFPFTLDGVAFAICIGGNAKVKINFNEYEVSKDTIMTIMPHSVIEYSDQSEDLMIEFLIFAPDFITEMPMSNNIDIAKSIIQNPCLKITEQESEKYLEFHSFIVKQYRRKDHPFRIALAKNLLYSLLIEVGSIYYNQLSEQDEKNMKSNSYQDDMVYRFFKLLLLHHKEERSVNFYANKMCITPKYLSTIVKDRTGRTAFSCINEALISTIKFLLKTTDKTVFQISDEMNFPNPSFFGRFFKKHTGMTPMHYRESK
ncbi:MAG: helix-turn-helix domain-containing protein [Dysgonomonas sp.]